MVPRGGRIGRGGLWPIELAFARGERNQTKLTTLGHSWPPLQGGFLEFCLLSSSTSLRYRYQFQHNLMNLSKDDVNEALG
jgi:hypothetical protein